MDQEAAELMETLDVPVLASDAKAVQAVDAMDDLKQEILGFFKNRIKSISRAERIKELIFEQFEMDIQSGALKFDQMMSLLMRLDRDNNDSADSIISMFRPSGNGQGSLLTEIVRPGTDKSDLAKAIENYSPEELRKINETFKAIRELVESGGTVSVETQDGKNPAVEM
jgi:hypothetical protein